MSKLVLGRGLVFGALACALPHLGCAMDEPPIAEDVRCDAALYGPDHPLAVPLASLPDELRDIAALQLRMVATALEGTWQGAELAQFAVPLLRPDVDGPAYYELKVLRGPDSLGFMILSAGDHDRPIVEFATHGATKAEELVARAGAHVRALYRLDSNILVAEDARGEIADATSPTIPVAPASDDLATPVELGAWTGWPSLKRDFARGFRNRISWRRSDGAAEWDGMRVLRAATTNVARSLSTIEDLGNVLLECERNWAGPNSGSTNPDDLTARWAQLTTRHVTTAQPATSCNSGCTPTAAGIILAWMDVQSRRWDSGRWSRPEMGRAFFSYRQPLTLDELPFVDYGYRAPYIPRPSYLAMRLPGNVYDYRTTPSQTWPAEDPEHPNISSPSSDLRRYLGELGMAMGTHCNGSDGWTVHSAIPRLQNFFDDHRIPVQMSTGHNLATEIGFRENIIHALRTTGAPGFIHTSDFGGHHEVVSAHMQCNFRDKASGNIIVYGPVSFFTNKGMGQGNGGNGWLTVNGLQMATTFTPKSPFVKLTASHSNKCADVPWGAATPGLELKQYYCHGGANQRWEFRPVGQDAAGNIYEIRNQASNMCMDVLGGAPHDHAPIGQWHCNGSVNANQRWRTEIRSDGRFLIRSMVSNKCLEVAGVSQGDNVALIQYNCDDWPSQVWDLTL